MAGIGIENSCSHLRKMMMHCFLCGYQLYSRKQIEKKHAFNRQNDSRQHPNALSHLIIAPLVLKHSVKNYTLTAFNLTIMARIITHWMFDRVSQVS